MATKGQKFKKTSNKLKKQILNEFHDGKGKARELGEKYKISFHTIETWINKERHGINICKDNRKKNSGRPKTNNLTIEDYKERYEILKKYQAFLEARHGKK